MNVLLTRGVPLAAVLAALVGGCAGVLAQAEAPAGASGFAQVRAAGDGLSLTGDGGALPRFDLRDLAPGQGVTRTFVVVRERGGPPAALRLDAPGLVGDEVACLEPEREQDTTCAGGEQPELPGQLRVRVQHARHTVGGGCGPLQDAVPTNEVALDELAAEPVLVRPLLGGLQDERTCVALTLLLPEARDDDAVQGERLRFDLRFAATPGGTP